jgi:UDP-glucose 4-epimerase
LNSKERKAPLGKVMITGGAGFIGSHVANYISARNEEVLVVDNLSTGRLDNLASLIGRRGFSFLNKDIRESDEIDTRDVQTVIHLAAMSNVRESGESPSSYLRGNIESTFSLLEKVRHAKSIRTFVMASTSAIYGETKSASIGEHHGPTEPFSVYGATKLACEGLVSAYAHSYGFHALILRFGNIVGPKMRNGVVYDFIAKLLRNADHLEIWGSGKQTKTYLHVIDLTEALIFCLQNAPKDVDFFNIASSQELTVLEVANIVINEMGLSGVSLMRDANADGLGFVGDLMREILDNSKLSKLGWRQRYSSAEAIRLTARALLGETSSVSIISHRQLRSQPRLQRPSLPRGRVEPSG